MSQVQADAIHDRYRKGFVGRSRATRDLTALDAIIADAAALAPGADGALASALADRLALYREERTQIAAIQAGGPTIIAAWGAVEASELDFACYKRRFAGQNRATRDLGLLTEMAAHETARLAGFPANIDDRLRTRKEQMASNLRMYTGELTAIPEARNLLAPTEQARVLATAANQQFDVWRRHFEGKARASRRPALLERAIAALEGIRVRMVAIRDMGVQTDVHTANLAKVTDRIAHFSGELEKIRTARAGAGAADIGRAHGDEANKVFSAYRAEYSGKPRAAADVARLSVLCDDLHEVARSMRLLQQERPNEANAKNLDIVLDHLKMMEREHTAIVEARKPAAKA